MRTSVEFHDLLIQFGKSGFKWDNISHVIAQSEEEPCGSG